MNLLMKARNLLLKVTPNDEIMVRKQEHMLTEGHLCYLPIQVINVKKYYSEVIIWPLHQT